MCMLQMNVTIAHDGNSNYVITSEIHMMIGTVTIGYHDACNGNGNYRSQQHVLHTGAQAGQPGKPGPAMDPQAEAIKGMMLDHMLLY